MLGEPSESKHPYLHPRCPDLYLRLFENHPGKSGPEHQSQSKICIDTQGKSPQDVVQLLEPIQGIG